MIPKSQGARTDIKLMDTAVQKLPTKAEVIEQAGFTQKQAERFQTLAAHPEIVEQAKAKARENGDVVLQHLSNTHPPVCVYEFHVMEC